MTVTLTPTEAQENFSAMLDRALSEDDVVVERDGTPQVAIVNYRRYQMLIGAETELVRLRLQQASAVASARAAELSDTDLDHLIKEVRTEANNGAKH